MEGLDAKQFVTKINNYNCYNAIKKKIKDLKIEMGPKQRDVQGFGHTCSSNNDQDCDILNIKDIIKLIIRVYTCSREYIIS